MSMRDCSNYHFYCNELEQTKQIIANNYSATKDIGLLNGKMGVAIFFFHYYRYYKKEEYEDIAISIISNIYEHLSADYSPNYREGIAGIGVGIDYLAHYGFITIDDDFWTDFDDIMYRAVINHSHEGYTLYDGLLGYARYWTMRGENRMSSIAIKSVLESIVHNFGSLNEIELFDIYNLLVDLNNIELYSCVTRTLIRDFRQNIDCIKYPSPKDSFPRLDDTVFKNIVKPYYNSDYLNIPWGVEELNYKDISDNIFGMGLQRGLAGKAMYLMTYLGGKTSWIGLL